MSCCCPKRENKTIVGEFPKNITGTKQYGNNLKAFAVALSTVGMVSIDRIHWKCYLQYNEATHGICNAHILRELVYAEEQMNQNWAKSMQDLLLEMNSTKKTLQEQEATCFQNEVLQEWMDRYDALIREGLGQNVPPEKPKGKRGRPAKGKTICLLERLRDYKEDILRFATDWRVPFTNNEAERSIRFSKVKQKVSGCFRTMKSAKSYMQIMSYISTAHKHGISYFEAVHTAPTGNALKLVEQLV